MLIRSILSLSAATCLLLAVPTAQAEEGMPGQSLLNEMGLASIDMMSDDEAMEIRGLGYYPKYNHVKPVAIAYGHSYAGVTGHGAQAYSEDGFYARGPHKAAGAHGSFAGLIVKQHGGPHGGGSHGNKRQSGGHSKPKPQGKKVIAFSGGFSFASTK